MCFESGKEEWGSGTAVEICSFLLFKRVLAREAELLFQLIFRLR